MLNRVRVAMETFVRLTAYPPTHPTLYGGQGKKKKACGTNQKTFIDLNKLLPRISSQGISTEKDLNKKTLKHVLSQKFQFFSELEILFCTFLIWKRRKSLQFNLLTITVYFKQTSMNAPEPFTIATIPTQRALTPLARLVVHVNLCLREME